MAGKPKYRTAKELEEKINSYFARVEEVNDTPPIWEELLGYLGITKNTWDTYKSGQSTENMSDEEKIEKIRISEVIKKAEEHLSSELVKYGLKNPNRQSLIIFFLKQKHYGGYTDKQEIEHKDLKIDVKINGVNGNPFN